ncbi:hypothetical protein SDC9_204605 [bioreactor metagenome]|uniref:Uncharacterized protein n=1 Tax=bioreactor metagenome TaxID=1076179 RepID=A0A645J1C9_9ZZZZ
MPAPFQLGSAPCGWLRRFQQFDVLVPLQAGAGGNQLADDHVLLQAFQRIDLAFDSGFSQYARGLLEGGGGEEALRGQ